MDPGDRQQSFDAVSQWIKDGIIDMSDGPVKRASTGVGVGSSIGSSRLVVRWCVLVEM